MVGVIYKIVNNYNGKVYIGQTWRSLDVRFSEHKRSKCIKLSNAFNKYGIKNFSIECLTVCYTQESLDFYEVLFIKQCASIDNGYNIKTGGDGGGLHSDSTKKKISRALAGKYVGKNSHRYGQPMSTETRKKISDAKKGKRCSPDTEFKKGRKYSIEEKTKMSESRRGNKNHMYGKAHSADTKQKISKTLIGKYKAENSPNSKINQEIADNIRYKRILGFTQKQLSDEFKLSKTQIYAIIRNERWPSKP